MIVVLTMPTQSEHEGAQRVIVSLRARFVILLSYSSVHARVR